LTGGFTGGDPLWKTLISPSREFHGPVLYFPPPLFTLITSGLLDCPLRIGCHPIFSPFSFCLLTFFSFSFNKPILRNYPPIYSLSKFTPFLNFQVGRRLSPGPPPPPLFFLFRVFLFLNSPYGLFCLWRDVSGVLCGGTGCWPCPFPTLAFPACSFFFLCFPFSGGVLSLFLPPQLFAFSDAPPGSFATLPSLLRNLLK